MGATQDKELLLSDDGLEKMMLLLKLCTEFPGAVHRQVDRPAQAFFRASQSRGQVGQADLANDHYVYITAWAFFTAGKGAIDKGARDRLRERFKSLPQDVDEPNGLGQDGAQFWEQGAVGIGLEVNPVSLAPADENARIHQTGQLTLKA